MSNCLISRIRYGDGVSEGEAEGAPGDFVCPAGLAPVADGSQAVFCWRFPGPLKVGAVYKARVRPFRVRLADRPGRELACSSR